MKYGPTENARHPFLNGMIILAAATATVILLETLLLPVLQIFGSSMVPTVYDGEFVVAMRHVVPKRGDIIAFYSGDKILVKRVIGLPGEQISMDKWGRVYIDGELLDEPYLEKTAVGGCDIGFPCRVPEEAVFVMGDNREVSMDSRNSAVGCVQRGQFIGKLIFRIWPLSAIGMVK